MTSQGYGGTGYLKLVTKSDIGGRGVRKMWYHHTKKLPVGYDRKRTHMYKESGLVKKRWFGAYILFEWSLVKTLQLEQRPTWLRRPHMLQTISVNKEASSNWPPISENNLPVQCIKSTLHYIDALYWPYLDLKTKTQLLIQIKYIYVASLFYFLLVHWNSKILLIYQFSNLFKAKFMIWSRLPTLS